MMVAEALVATPAVTHVTHARQGRHSDVQLRCRIDGEPTDVTVLTSSKRPDRAIQAAAAATQRDRRHIIVTRNAQVGARVNHWLRSPVAESTDDGLRFYDRTPEIKHDGAIVVTADETEPPAWWVRGTDADSDRDRVYELRSAGRVLATADLDDGTIALNENNWTTVEPQYRPTAGPAVTPTTEYRAASETATWRPVMCPVTVESTTPLTESTVYALSEEPDDGITLVDDPAQRDEWAATTESTQAAVLVEQVLTQYTVKSPGTGISYDELFAVTKRHAEAADCAPLYKNFFSEALSAEPSVTTKRVAEDGEFQRQVRGRTWAVPSSEASE
ncbi:hypothetical protein [Halorubrum persicum]|nr:hypothetical protein [Halorubrum persicum]